MPEVTLRTVGTAGFRRYALSTTFKLTMNTAADRVAKQSAYLGSLARLRTTTADRRLGLVGGVDNRPLRTISERFTVT